VIDERTEFSNEAGLDLASLHAEIAGELQAYLLGIVRNREVAGDLTQETFTKLVERPPDSAVRSARAWAFRVAHNLAIDWKRRQSRERSCLGGDWWQADRKTAGENTANLLLEEQKERIQAAIGRLPEEQRTVVRMRIFEEKKFALIAEELKLPLGTVLTRMRLALEKLSRSLADERYQ